jgi:hypothetical protein
MKNKIWLIIILCFYSILYVATTKQYACDQDCENLGAFNQEFKSTRNYVDMAYRCSRTGNRDTLCVFFRDTTGVNWSLLGDTACTLATQHGLSQQRLLFIVLRASGRDTVLKKICP